MSHSPKCAAITVLVAVLALASRASGQSTVPLDKLLSPAQYRAAGLRKLTSSERDSLSRYVTDYGQAVAKALLDAMLVSSTKDSNVRVSAPVRSLATEPIQTEAVIESRIAGEFKGWDGETIFRLQNGQIWQQALYAYTYHYAYAPPVTIYRSGGQFKMKVEGVEAPLVVRRLK